MTFCLVFVTHLSNPVIKGAASVSMGRKLCEQRTLFLLFVLKAEVKMYTVVVHISICDKAMTSE